MIFNNKISKLTGIIIFIFICNSSFAERYINTSAKYVFLMDYETERVLLEKSSNIPTAPASMSKLMTIYLAFEALKQENILPASAMSPNYKYVVFISVF